MSFSAKGAESRSPEAVGKKIVADAEVSFGPKPNIVKAGDYTFFAGSRSDAFFFDFDGIKNLFDISGKRNFTEPHLSGQVAVDWRGFKYRSQRFLDGGGTANERTRQRNPNSASGDDAACGRMAS